MIPHHAVLLSAENPLTYTPAIYETLSTGDQLRQPQFGIKEAKDLISIAHRRPDGSETVRTILIATEFITEEAQQALLKILEEPPLSTRFVFILPEGYTLLPTLESRFQRTLHIAAETEVEEFKTFSLAPYKERLELIEASVKKKDAIWQATIKKGLLNTLRSSNHQYEELVVRELEYISRLLLTRGASNKFLLEHLALTLPLRDRVNHVIIER